MKNGYLSPQEAADKLAVSLDTVRRMLRTGVLHGTKVGKQWRIHQKDIDEYLARDLSGEELEELYDDEEESVGDRADLRMLIEELQEEYIGPLTRLIKCLRDRRKDFRLLHALVDLLAPLRKVRGRKELMEVVAAIQADHRS